MAVEIDACDGSESARSLSVLDAVSVGRRLLNVTVSVPSGVTAVIGPSGSGKSTLLDLLCGVIEPSRGSIHREFPTGGDGVPVLWCGCGEGLWPHRTVAEQISAVGGDPGEWLPRFELAERKEVRPDLLSQGQRSRLELARALAAKPTTLVLDEPLTHVDRRRAMAGWEFLDQWARTEGRSLIFATHDLAAARRLATFVICLSDEPVDSSLADCGLADRVFDSPANDAAAWAVGTTAAGAFGLGAKTEGASSPSSEEAVE